MTDEQKLYTFGDAPEPIVALCECKGRMFLATQSRIYELTDGVWRPMVFAIELEPPPQ